MSSVKCNYCLDLGILEVVNRLSAAPETHFLTGDGQGHFLETCRILRARYSGSLVCPQARAYNRTESLERQEQKGMA